MHPFKIAILSVIAATILVIASNTPGRPVLSAPEDELPARVKEIFDTRARAVITGADPGPALAGYDTGSKYGQWAYSHEQSKLCFIQAWAQKRGVRITGAASTISVPWSKVRGNTAEFQIKQTLQLGYVYPGEKTVNHFGIGTRHWLQLVKRDGRWLIRRDFYTDGLGDDTLVPKPTPADGPACAGRISRSGPPLRAVNGGSGLYDRPGAAGYADKYAGLAWGAGNRHQYNPHYRDLNGNGGDCTNFVSQCLGDREGGKLPMDGTWYYRHDRRGGSGSRAWVQTEAFASWLLYSGRAERLAQGGFNELNRPGVKFPRGAVRELQKGDVIGYEEKGHIEHFAVVVGADSHGYPLVNAHTVDRYHCPWDMGWDKRTVFHLFRIKY
ncbi:amidase domain-containing protein [Desulfotomaculum copahuensis]|nr:amidase domain-containing protein [Desulfotomaculum copahuensis]